jgi:MraZ protein
VVVALFLSTFVNKVDKKGRVSVPAPFRTALIGQSFAGVIAWPSLVAAALEGSGIDRFEQLADGTDDVNPFSEEHADFAKAVFGRSHQLAFDGDGRIVLPEVLIAHANLSEQAAFVGQGKVFQIWEPQAYRDHERQAIERARRARGAFLRRSEEPRS